LEITDNISETVHGSDIGRVLKYAPECFEVLLCYCFIIKQTAQ